MLALTILFLLGIANFTLHSAVLDSGHAMLQHMPGLIRRLGGRLTLLGEFAVLVVAMLLSANGWGVVACFYAAYTALNAISAWLILTRKI